MAHDNQIAQSQLSHMRTSILICIAIGAVLIIAIASGLAYNIHEKIQQGAALQSEQAAQTAAQSQQEPLPDDDNNAVNEEKVEPMQTPQSTSGDTNNEQGSSSNSSSTSAKVTINGRTVEVMGNGSLQKTYTSDDGHTKVNISIKNKQESH